MNLPLDFTAVVLDIEGTTTPISFVHDVLFPWASDHLEAYLTRHWHEPTLQADVANLIARAEDEASSVPAAQSVLAAQHASSHLLPAVVDYLSWQIKTDQKRTVLKSIQGRIWRDGYRDGHIKAPVFDDVLTALERWQRRDIPVYIYSSGSVQAQKLLFSHTEHGDLTPLLAGYFDTETGPKKEASSYHLIANSIGLEPRALLFLTDNLYEARAARSAGWRVAIASRPGNASLPSHDFPVVTHFGALTRS